MIMCVSDNFLRKGGCELDQSETKVDITSKLDEGKIWDGLQVFLLH